MTIQPTEYDKGQDSRITGIESLVKTTYTAPTGTEISYPIVGQPMDNLQWQFVTLGMGSGILDEGGQPYWLRNLDNATDTAKLTVSTTKGNAQSIIRGFYHRLLADLTINLPAVSATTTYYICLTYDPLKHSAPEGPIRVVVYAGPPDTTSGKLHLVLWEVTRSASQLLTNATVLQKRPKVAPTLTVDTRDQLPELRSVIWGTYVFVTHGTSVGEIFFATGADPAGHPQKWQSLTNPEWKNLPLPSGYTAQWGLTPQYRISQNRVELSGLVARDSGEFPSGQDTVIGWVSGLNLPDFNCAVIGTGARQARLGAAVGGSGIRDNFRIYPREAGLTWFSLDNVRIPLA